jgi:hypothetical protein
MIPSLHFVKMILKLHFPWMDLSKILIKMKLIFLKSKTLPTKDHGLKLKKSKERIRKLTMIAHSPNWK